MALSAFFSIVQSSIFRSQGHEIAPPEDPLSGSAVFQRTVLYRQRITDRLLLFALYSDNAPLFPLAVNGVSVQVKGQLGRGIFLAVLEI